LDVCLQVNRLASAYDFDSLLVSAAEARGYTMAQITIQPNSNGGWAHEVILTTPSSPTIGSWTQWFNYVISQVKGAFIPPYISLSPRQDVHADM
jgi:hypothetical protein